VASLWRNCENLWKPLCIDTNLFWRIILKNIVIIATLSSLLGGCATITRGTTNDIQITSEPSGANAKTSMSQTCVTPCVIKVGRKDEFQVTFNKDGYKEAIIPVKTQVAGAGVAGMAGSVLVGGIIGVGFDAYSGAAYEHVPNPVHAVLERNKPEAKAVVSRKKGKKTKMQPKSAPVAESIAEDVQVEPAS
jgi:hypothetical protein